MVIVATFPFGVQHLIPSSVERILRGLKPLLLLLQAPRCGQEFSAEVILFRMFFRDDERIIDRTVLFFGGSQMSSAL